ncbi:MAG: hypothetical protein GF308_03985 [Candidatus Heimdallarchaeota archaeon]|nr:hypothetical protein [Candidatus Heimdallarchaeota archaeon]
MDSPIDKTIYLTEVLQQIPRLLAQLDRNKMSKTYGCFDRNYWHYKIVDFPSARMQEAALTLALLYTIDSRDNPYYQNKKILEWIKAALLFWGKIQEKNGSFNEWWPHENSYVATAFSSYAVSETLLLLKEQLTIIPQITQQLVKAADFLSKSQEALVQNQECGAVIAIYNTFLLTGNEKYKNIAAAKVQSILSFFSEEGWLVEYGGPDVGYLSLAFDYLAKYYQKTQDKELLEKLKNATQFLQYFLHPNFTHGGEYASRNTEYLIPSGFELLVAEIPECALLACFARETMEKRNAITPFALDDRYLCQILYNWLEAYMKGQKKLSCKKDYPFKNTFEQQFPEAGIFIKSTPTYYFITNYKKGGSFKLIEKSNGTVTYDSGILLTCGNKTYETNCINEDIHFEFTEHQLTIKGSFFKIDQKLQKAFTTIALRFYSVIFGRFERISRFIKNVLRRVLITGSNKSKHNLFTRTFVFKETEVVVSDAITTKKKMQEVILGAKFSFNYIPSSRYFQTSELESPSQSFDLSQAEKKKEFHHKRSFMFKE